VPHPSIRSSRRRPGPRFIQSGFRRLLEREQLADPLFGQVEQAFELGLGEAALLAGGLDLDDVAAPVSTKLLSASALLSSS
jgi:hypothetical protein